MTTIGIPASDASGARRYRPFMPGVKPTEASFG
jgi:hypothetical protein